MILWIAAWISGWKQGVNWWMGWLERVLEAGCRLVVEVAPQEPVLMLLGDGSATKLIGC